MDEKGKIKYHFGIVDYFGKIEGGRLRAVEDVAEAKWVSLKELEKYRLTKTFKEFFGKHGKELEILNSCNWKTRFSFFWRLKI